MAYDNFPHLKKALNGVNELADGANYKSRIESAFDSRLDQQKIDAALGLGFYALHTDSHKEQRRALRSVLLASYLRNPCVCPITVKDRLVSKYGSLSTTALRGTFRTLMDAGSGLVNHFNSIRAWSPVGAQQRHGATISIEQRATLRQLDAPAPHVHVCCQTGPAQGCGEGLGGYAVEMVCSTQFYSHVRAAKPTRVIRFVRAAKVMKSVVRQKMESLRTHPGYMYWECIASEDIQEATEEESWTAKNAIVTLKVPAAPVEDVTSQRHIECQLASTFHHADWEFDGPRDEFVQSENPTPLFNRDTPGTNRAAEPFAIAAEFWIVLYNEDARLVYEVGNFGAAWALWENGTQGHVELNLPSPTSRSDGAPLASFVKTQRSQAPVRRGSFTGASVPQPLVAPSTSPLPTLPSSGRRRRGSG